RFGVVSAFASAKEDRTRRTQGDELVRIHWQVVPVQRTGVFEKIAGHPMVFVDSGDVLDDLAPVAPMEFRATFAGGADVRGPHARLISHRHNRRLTVTRVTLNGDVFGVD